MYKHYYCTIVLLLHILADMGSSLLTLSTTEQQIATSRCALLAMTSAWGG